MDEDEDDDKNIIEKLGSGHCKKGRGCFIIYKSQQCRREALPSGRRLLIKLVPEGISSRKIFVWYNSLDWLYCFRRSEEVTPWNKRFLLQHLCRYKFNIKFVKVLLSVLGNQCICTCYFVHHCSSKLSLFCSSLFKQMEKRTA